MFDRKHFLLFLQNILGLFTYETQYNSTPTRVEVESIAVACKVWSKYLDIFEGNYLSGIRQFRWTTLQGLSYGKVKIKILNIHV